MRYAFILATLVLLGTPAALHAGGMRVGLNGVSCAFPSLSAAIAASQPGDVVYAEPARYTERLVITHTLRFRPAVAGCGSEDVSGRVTVDGATLPAAVSGGLVHISGGAGALFTRFDFRNGQAQRGGIAAVFQDGELVLRDSTFALGTATGADGGGCVLIEDSSLGMDNGSMIVDCTASAGPGGGVRAIDSALTLTGPGAIGFIDAGNSASGDGGGIHATGSTITAQSFVMLDNRSDNDGGAVHAEGSTLVFDSCDISLNQTRRNGGAFSLLGPSASTQFVDSTMFQNATTDNVSNAGGGAVYATGTMQITLTGSGLFDNTSSNLGGAIVLRSNADLVASQSAFEGNDANGPGGAIYAAQSATSVELTDVTFTDNSANTTGGALNLVFAHVSAVRTTFASNSAGSDGGAAYFVLIDDVIPLHNVRMVGNTAGSDGGALFLNDALVELRAVMDGADACDTGALGPGEHCAELTGNQATERGGGVASSMGSLTTEGAWLQDNLAGTTGGALWATEFVLTLQDTRIEGNQSATHGGGLHLEEAGGGVTTLMGMTGGRFASNQTVQAASNAGGGGAYLINVDADFVDVEIEDNSAPSSGGFLHARNGSDVSVTGGSIVGNSSNASGGAFYIAQSASLLTLESTVLANNVAGTTGGGIMATFTPVNVRDVLIAGNSADRGGGAFLWLNNGSLFSNTQVIGNSASEVGGGLYLLEAHLTLLSDFIGGSGCQPAALGIDEYCTEVRSNTAVESGGGIYLEGSDTSGSGSPRLFADGVAFIDNHAGQTGAAIEIEDASPDTDLDGPIVELVNVLIKESSDATLEVEAVRVGEDAVVLLDSATLVANHGAPLHAEGDDFDLTVMNTLMWANGLGPFASFDGLLDRSCSNVQASQGGSQFFGSGVDPQFVTTTRGPYRLDPATSPLIDACNDGPAWDLDGGLRPGRLAWDIGAFEVDPAEPSPQIFVDGFESET